MLKIQQKTTGNSSLEFFKGFADLATKKYQLQITKDYESLTLGHQLLDSSLNTLRSRVEVNQAKRDRTFQDSVAVLGIGLGVASVSGSPEDFCQTSSNPIAAIVENSPICEVQLLYSLFVGAVAALIAWLLILLWTRIS